MSYKRRIASVLANSPIVDLWESKIKMPRILFYHGVINNPYVDKRVQANQIQLDAFHKQITFLRNHYRFISLDEFYRSFIQKSFVGNELVITFDDGYKNNNTIVAPYLQEQGIPFAVFISSNLVDNEGFVPTYLVRSALLSQQMSKLDSDVLKKKFILDSVDERQKVMNMIIHYVKTENEDNVIRIVNEIETQLGKDVREEINSKFETERIMSWSDAAEITRGGGIIGSHSEDHSILHEKQSSDFIETQLKRSKEKIERQLGRCDYFAFPNGDKKSVCKRSLEMALNIYKMSFAVTGKSVSYRDPLEFVSRICSSFDINVMRVQLSILS